MIILFVIGSLATTLGILAAWFIISPEAVLGEDGRIIAGMLTGTYTGVASILTQWLWNTIFRSEVSYMPELLP